MTIQHRSRQAEQDIRHIRSAIANQKARLDRMTAQGLPTQAATDVLSKMSADLMLMQRCRKLWRG